ncbi:DnaJ domain-containing protein [Rhodobacter sphaeroides]|uniref:J domain-containing protein n=1 Tax=Cereibacter sphaeroides TaxID=1063 RepID=UPI0013293041|nr:J domain-containing protein [Cereibacter sphaeroides]MWP40292.1 DnaJ domain-containing protein [Cereibacter sphaeroides]
MTDHYTVLGVPRDASTELITAAYRALAKAFHPDVFNVDRSFASSRLREILAAYEILSDPGARAAYDQLLQAQRGKAQEDLKEDQPGSHSRSTPGGEWSRVIDFFPELAEHEREIREIDIALSVNFQRQILKTRGYADGAITKQRILAEFAKSRFGREVKLQLAGLAALRQGRRRFALELNKACLLIGEDQADTILRRLAIEFDDDARQIYSACNLQQYLPNLPGQELELGVYGLGGMIKFRVLPNMLLVFNEYGKELIDYRRFANYDLLLRNYPNVPPFLKRIDDF